MCALRTERSFEHCLSDAGYYSTTARIPEKRDSLQKVTAEVESLTALQTIEKVWGRLKETFPARAAGHRTLCSLHHVPNADNVQRSGESRRCQVQAIGEGGNRQDTTLQDAAALTPGKLVHSRHTVPLQKLSNAKIKAAIVDTEGALATMRELGWQEGEEDGEAVLSLKGAATMAQVCVGVGGFEAVLAHD